MYVPPARKKAAEDEEKAKALSLAAARLEGWDNQMKFNAEDYDIISISELEEARGMKGGEERNNKEGLQGDGARMEEEQERIKKERKAAARSEEEEMIRKERIAQATARLLEEERAKKEEDERMKTARREKVVNSQAKRKRTLTLTLTLTLIG